MGGGRCHHSTGHIVPSPKLSLPGDSPLIFPPSPRLPVPHPKFLLVTVFLFIFMYLMPSIDLST